MSDLMLDVDQASELKAAFRRGNWTNADIKRLSEGDLLAQVREVVLGCSRIIAIDHMIDCDADPFLPEGWKAEEHRKCGKFTWDPSKVSLYLSPNQTEGKSIEGNKLRDELAKLPVLNANVLDYLLKNPVLIPNEWKGKRIFFWGTIYRNPGTHLCVRYLYWAGASGRWFWNNDWLIVGWYRISPAAVSV